VQSVSDLGGHVPDIQPPLPPWEMPFLVFMDKQTEVQGSY
jgi:hypothetical protein